MKTPINFAIILMLGAVMFSGCAGKLTDNGQSNTTPAGVISSLTLRDHTATLTGTTYISGTPYATVGTRNATTLVTSNVTLNGSFYAQDNFTFTAFPGSYGYNLFIYKSFSDGLYIVNGLNLVKVVSYPILSGNVINATLDGQPAVITVMGYENVTTPMGTFYCAKIKYAHSNGSEIIQWVNETHFNVKQEINQPGVYVQTLFVKTDNL